MTQMIQTQTSKKTFTNICDCCDRDILYRISDIGLGNLVQCSNCECERFACSLCMAGNGGDCIAYADDSEEVCVAAIDAALEGFAVKEVVSA